MQITDFITITELSKLLGKSRPTVYKYISDYEAGNYAALPHSVKSLFDKIISGETSKRGVFEYCDHWFLGNIFSKKRSEDKTVNVNEIILLIKDNATTLNLSKLKKYIEEELKK